MDNTKTTRNMYTTEIVETVRQRLGLMYDDESMDQDILNMSKGEVFKHVVNWNGLLGSYDDTIKNWILDIYNVDLDEEE